MNRKKNALTDRVISRGMCREKSGEREGRMERQTEWNCGLYT